MKSIFVYVPDDLHFKFRKKVFEAHATIKDTILSFVTLYVGEENGKKQKEEPKADSKKNKK